MEYLQYARSSIDSRNAQLLLNIIVLDGSVAEMYIVVDEKVSIFKPTRNGQTNRL